MAASSEKKHRFGRIGIKWKMFAILIFFIVAVIAVIWLFQVKFLDYFYQNIKFSELEETAEDIEPLLGDEEALRNKVFENADKYSLYIRIFSISDNTATEITEANGGRDMLMPFITRRILNGLYNKALENGGVYIATVSMDALMDDLYSEIIDGEKKPSNGSGADTSENARVPDGSLGAVYAKITEKDGVQYLIIQTSDLSPLHATVNTLKKQFLWIGIILVILALGLAALMSKVITKPIIRMNSSAQQLALGRYDVGFSGKGYREICELSDALNFASVELSKTDKLQKELISNISHDLRTPLTMIKGYSEMMRDIPGENTPENVQVIIDETERLSDLVSDMLDISRIQAGTRKPELSVFSLTATVRDTMARYEKLTMQDGYRIEFYAERDVEIRADRGMILQVVYNLINNAINYTGEDKYVCVRQSLNGSRVRISVSDTGEGIAEEQIPLIWDRYYKVDRVHRRATVGTGLGLSIVKGILELHNATYGVQSVIGKGSTFWFELDTFPDAASADGASDI